MRRGGPATDAVVVLTWFVAAGLVGSVLWWQLAPEVLSTQTEAGPALDSEQVVRQVGIDGWFAVIGFVGGLVSGVVLLGLRSVRPLLSVALVVLGGGIASTLMLRVGHLLGPGDPAAVLEGAAVGTTAPLDLALQAGGLVWLWPLGAAFGAVVQLLVLAPPVPDEPEGDDAFTQERIPPPIGRDGR